MRELIEADLGKGQRFRLKAERADSGSMVSMVRENASGRMRHREREEGQVLVEFALLLPFFLLIVVGIIQFGLALNFWLDMQRIANQGARWAVVNSYPGCPRTGPNTPCNPTLQTYLANERSTQGQNLNVRICFPSGVSTLGNPVKVIIKQPLTFFQIVRLPGITLTATATMRLEQTAGRYTANGTGSC